MISGKHYLDLYEKKTKTVRKLYNKFNNIFIDSDGKYSLTFDNNQNYLFTDLYINYSLFRPYFIYENIKIHYYEFISFGSLYEENFIANSFESYSFNEELNRKIDISIIEFINNSKFKIDIASLNQRAKSYYFLL